MKHRLLPFVLVSLTLAACAAPDADEDTESAESMIVAGFDAAAEAADLAHLDARRAAAGKRALVRKACLDGIARDRARINAASGSLVHSADVPGLVRARCGVGDVATGENIAYDGSEAAVWNRWLASPPHRANIDQSTYDVVGIGAYRRADGLVFMTQVFARF